jgi:hypothetical protein
VALRSSPFGPDDGKVGEHGGGRIVYWREPDGHAWELLTVSYARQANAGALRGAGPPGAPNRT